MPWCISEILKFIIRGGQVIWPVMDFKQKKMDLLTCILTANHDTFINLKMTDLELDGDEPLNCHEPGEDD